MNRATGKPYESELSLRFFNFNEVAYCLDHTLNYGRVLPFHGLIDALEAQGLDRRFLLLRTIDYALYLSDFNLSHSWFILLNCLKAD